MAVKLSEADDATLEALLEASQDAISDVADLAAHPGWPQIVHLLERRIEGLRKGLAKPAQTRTIEEVRFVQGMIAAFEELKIAPRKAIDRITERTTRAVTERGGRGHEH